ncbi:hypothetical protein BGZ96_006813, partial [Linnemannia gamsii]
MTNDTPVPNFRYPHPKPFNNVRDGFAIMEFIDGMELFFEGAHIPLQITSSPLLLSLAQ